MHGLLLLSINKQTTFEVPSLTDSKDSWGPNLKKNGSHGPESLTTPIREYIVIPRLTLDVFYLLIKFGDFRFSRSRDMIAGVEI